ncbi:MAG: thiamine biosynthesis protein ThiS [Planctomycetota bacterium]|jgi:thiamine biosynthesis protein ThiS
MQITVNGKDRDVADGISVAELLSELDLDSVRVALELNRKLVTRKDHSATLISDGDHLEIVTLVGGG